MRKLEWFGCYSESWQGEIVPDAFSHPAKYARGLIGRIYDHMLSMGYIVPGDTVGDPFGGVALGAIHAMLKGCNWIGVELEPKFQTLGNQNLDLWRGKYGDLLRGTAVLVQGDSRQFLQHVAGLGGVVSSAPFENSISSMTENNSFDFSVMAKNRTNKWGRSGSKDDLENQAKLDKARLMGRDYGDHPENIGNDSGATFWQAAAEIVQQTYAALKPGAYAAWVCGDYVRGGERVYFGQQWLDLCTAVGYEPIEWVIAWKTEHRGSQLDIFGNVHEKRVDRVSFFRRLANEKNPENAILNEDIIIVRKPCS